MKHILLAGLLLWTTVLTAGLPPTSSKVNGGAFSTTFKTDYGFIEGTRSGSNLTITGLGNAVAKSLDIDSYTTAAMNALTPVEGQTIYNSDYKSFATYNGTIWTYGFGNLAVISDWEDCGITTSDFTGFGTVTGISLQCKREGDTYKIKGKFVSGTTTAVEARLALRYKGVVLTSAGSPRLPSIQLANGAFWNNSAGANQQLMSLIEPSVGYFTFSGVLQTSGSASVDSKNNGTSVSSSGVTLYINAETPISDWTSNTSAWVQANSNPIATTTEFSASISSGGVVSNENVDWINGNAALSAGSDFNMTLNSGISTVPMNCTVTLNTYTGGSIMFGAVATASNIYVSTLDASNNVIYNPFKIKCSRQGADYTAAHSPFIIAPLAGTPNVPGYSGRVDSSSVSFGTTNSTTNCTASPCSYLDELGTALSSVTNITRAPTGVYTINFVRTYIKLKITGSQIYGGAGGIGALRGEGSCSNCNSITVNAYDGANNAIDARGTISFTGTY